MEKNEEELMDEDYKRFSDFWEKARDIVDEDGDNFLSWDISNIAHHSFTSGYEKGRQEVLDFIIAESLKLDNYQSARYAFESLIRKLKEKKHE